MRSLFSTSKKAPKTGASALEEQASEKQATEEQATENHALDEDALDKDAPDRGPDAPPHETPPAADKPQPEVTRKAVAEVLKYVIDPEVGINIVDLGLVYDLQIHPPHIGLTLTMTTPACPLSGHISNHARMILERVKGVDEVDVDIVWDPPWSPHMIEPSARAHLMGRPMPRHQ
jgi:metal-sulfur cluster biosynthetic enzyme